MSSVADRHVSSAQSGEVNANIEDIIFDCYCCNGRSIPRQTFPFKNPGLYSFLEDKVSRTYEQPYNWYYIVFTPMNRPYEKDPLYFANKGLIDCNKKLKSMKCHQVNILTKEKLECAKVHVNALTVTKVDLVSKYHNKKYKNKYHMHVQKCHVKTERYKVLKYITKEADVRPFYFGDDYLYYVNNKKSHTTSNVNAKQAERPRSAERDVEHVLIL